MNEDSILIIFIVEDDSALGESLATIFDLKGYAVELFENATAALECFIEGATPSVIVMDGDLPGLSGPEAMKKIREAGYEGELVGMSAGEYRDQMMEAGASSYWEKPFEIPEFLHAVETMISNA